jgi:hypothetical protein
MIVRGTSGGARGRGRLLAGVPFRGRIWPKQPARRHQPHGAGPVSLGRTAYHAGPGVADTGRGACDERLAGPGQDPDAGERSPPRSAPTGNGWPFPNGKGVPLPHDGSRANRSQPTAPPPHLVGFRPRRAFTMVWRPRRAARLCQDGRAAMSSRPAGHGRPHPSRALAGRLLPGPPPGVYACRIGSRSGPGAAAPAGRQPRLPPREYGHPASGTRCRRVMMDPPPAAVGVASTRRSIGSEGPPSSLALSPRGDMLAVGERAGLLAI